MFTFQINFTTGGYIVVREKSRAIINDKYKNNPQVASIITCPPMYVTDLDFY